MSYYQGEVLAACVEDPPFDLILDNIKSTWAPADPDGARVPLHKLSPSLKIADQLKPSERDLQPQTIAAVTTHHQDQQQGVPTVRSLHPWLRSLPIR
ncbi:hypothetical protein HPB50_010240 [Hyalomma asiaticum]|uniref:Uncharacterized protein n=1 Tax=Hyalomma asiaticum TaxID=266040 RepID=A0ACB7SFK9_HYAAI|nr:hypothetical protein HPB50_010240 [Hyalomma asiaticum]